MPLMKVGLKTVTANTYAQLTEFPAQPGTIVVSSGGTFYLSPTNTNADAYLYVGNSAVGPVQIAVSDMSAVWISSSTTQVFLSYYPAAETPQPM